LNRPILTTVHIGAWVPLNGYWYANGKLDDLGIWNRALTQQEITGMNDNCATPDITTNLVASYSFNGNANDGSGNLNNGTVTGATPTTDRFGNANTAYSFNGTSNYITVPLTSPLNTNNITGLTLSGWCSLNSLTSINSILNIFDASTPIKTYGIKYDGTSSPVFNGINGVDGSAATISVNGLGSPTINTWYNVVLTCDYSNNSSKLYINGVLQSQSSVILNRPILTTVHIGAWVPLNGYWYANGKLDDIKIYSRALTSCDVDSLFNEPNTFATGITEQINSNSIKVFPNPANDHITINYGNFASMSGYTLKITNNLGQVVFTSPINQQSSYIDLSTWTGNGIYFVQIIDNLNNTIENRKIVLQ
jgi:hypothetical protein